MKRIWPFSFYFLNYAAFASLLPFIVLFYQQLLFNGAQIGLLTGIPPLITLFAAPFGTGLADRTHRHKLIMGLGIAASAVIILLLPNVSSFVVVFTLIVLFNIFMAPVGSLGDSATMTMLGEQRDMYGRIRVGGTIGWLIFVQLAGVLLASYGLELLFYIFSLIMFINLFVVQKFSFGERVVQSSETGTIWMLLQRRRWIVFLSSAFLGGIGTFTVAAYFSPYMKELGANGGQIGFAFLGAAVVEIPFFLLGDKLIKRFTAYRLFLIGLVLIGVRSLLFGAVNNLWLAIAVMVVSGGIFAAMWVAGVAYADANSPAGLKSTALGLFGAFTFGFGAAVGGFVGGLLLESVGANGMFMIFGFVILIGLALIEGIKRLFPEKEFAVSEV